MDLTFRKEGLITVGSYDDTYSINLQDPFGKPIELNFNLKKKCNPSFNYHFSVNKQISGLNF